MIIAHISILMRL